MATCGTITRHLKENHIEGKGTAVTAARQNQQNSLNSFIPSTVRLLRVLQRSSRSAIKSQKVFRYVRHDPSVRAGQEGRPVQNLPLPPERESNLVDPFSCGREEVRDGAGLETGPTRIGSRQRKHNCRFGAHNGLIPICHPVDKSPV